MAERASSQKKPRSQHDGAARQLAAVLETAADAIVIIDDRGIIQTFNRASEKMFGYLRDEIVGKNVSGLMPEPLPRLVSS